MKKENHKTDNDYLSASKAFEMSMEAKRKIAANNFDTKQVLSEIEKQTELGDFEITTFYDEKVREDLILLGYKCSESFKKYQDEYMTVSWDNKKQADDMKIDDVVPMLENIANCIDTMVEKTPEEDHQTWDKIYDAVELLVNITEDNSLFVRR